MAKELPPKNLAGLDDPAIEAIVGGLFRLAKESQAVTILQRLSRKFIISENQEPISAGAAPTLTLWIHGFSITATEQEKGLVGNFARLVITTLPSGKITIIAEKIPTAIALHPIKNTPKRQNPNTGHPLVRAAVREKAFDSIDKLRSDLMKMHEEFPETTIPGQDKIYLMLYSKTSVPPVKKFKLSIAIAENEKFKLVLKEYIKKQPMTRTARQETGSPSEGKFATMVQARRKRKPKIKTSKKDSKTEAQ